ncbi:MAG TPA: putative glycoside hydrolase [Egibacteraceae bacterium]|nr:putative glycoside hydrolase [Egibacteraceae bacterium]
MGLGLAISLQSVMAAFAADGPDRGATLGQPDVTRLEFRAEAVRPGRLEGARLLLADEDVTDEATVHGDTLVYRPQDLADGEYTLTLEVQRGFPLGLQQHKWVFTVDTVPPSLTVTEPMEEVNPEEPVTIAGTVDTDAALTVDGTPVPVSEGVFSVTMERPPDEPVLLEAVDPIGNRTEEEFLVPVARSRPDQVRAVHVTAYSWVTHSLREPVIEMIQDGRINAVELDLKDESGDIGYDSRIPLAQEIGAPKGIYDLKETIAELHSLGVHVIGRIVAFRDPILGNAMWERGERDWVLQTPGGERYAGYGGFTNFAHPEVRQYNIDIAVEAAEAGIDDILYDYIRRPDGPIENLEIPRLSDSCDEPADPAVGCTPEESVVAFLAASNEQLRRYRVWHGASVYGIASNRPTQIAQDIPAMAEHADYIAPMVYPSHWARGEYDVADPNNQPYDIVHRSVTDFVELVDGTDTRIIPWLQDFSLGVRYGPEQVRAQIDAAADAGAPEWILWSPGVQYHAEALDGLD